MNVDLRPSIASPSRGAESAYEPATGRVLLIEDDAGDALLVEEMLTESSAGFEVDWVRSISDARSRMDDDVVCVLLDLGLPDAQGLAGLHAVLSDRPGAAVIVLTGLDDERRGAEAVAAGAQDYLVKNDVSPQLLSRAIRYAAERRRADANIRRLREADSLREQNARLERGLLPRPLIADTTINTAAWYRPGAYRALLSGDFYDVVELEDGTLRAIIGDVAGHGPDEAALGVHLRVAWRALVKAGLSAQQTFRALHELLVDETESVEIFATACSITISPDRTRAEVSSAGHPSPLVLSPAPIHIAEIVPGPALGLFDDPSWPSTTFDLTEEWAILLFTDGLIEGRVGNGSQRLGYEGLIDIAQEHWPDGTDLDDFVVMTVASAEARNGAGLPDDVALLLLERSTRSS